MEDWRVNKVNDGNWHKVTVDFYDHVSGVILCVLLNLFKVE